MVTRRILLLSGLGLVGAMAFGLFGCSNGNSIGPGGNTTSNVREFSALAGTPNSVGIDFYQRSLSTPTLASNILLGQSTAYRLIPAGNGINTFVVLTGTQAPILAQGSVTLDPHTTGQSNGTFTIVAAGVYGSAQGSATAPQIIRFIDNYPSLAQMGANNAAVRLINVAPGSPPLSLVNNSAAVPTTIPGLTGVTYGSVSSATGVISGTNYAPVPAGTYNLVVTDNVGNAVGSVSFTFAAGTPYTVWVYGVYPPANGGKLGVAVTTDTSNN